MGFPMTNSRLAGAIRKNKPRTPPWPVQVNEGLTA
jgi:hypothetical protein